MPIGYADFNIRDKLTARNKWETDEATLTLAESTWSSPVSYSTPTTLHNFLLSLTLGTATDITKTAVSFSIAGDVLHQLSFEFAESQYGLGISGGIFNNYIRHCGTAYFSSICASYSVRYRHGDYFPKLCIWRYGQL